MTEVPGIRVRVRNDGSVNPSADFVLYWMIAARRTSWNFGLQRAVEWAGELDKPLVILEALRCGYRWASDRLHAFIIEGMSDNRERLAGTNAIYYPYLERKEGEGKGLVAALAAHSCVVITDDFPCFFLPRMVSSAAKQVTVRLEQVDSNGMLPLSAAGRAFPTAHSFRRFLQKQLPVHLPASPRPDPLAGTRLHALEGLPKTISRRWPMASERELADAKGSLSALPIDHSVTRTQTRGGSKAANETLDRFLNGRLQHYAEARNHPDVDACSGLSPYLHFGHISVHQIFYELMTREGWSIDRVSTKATGKRSGWWGVSASAEEFLDQLVTWRELGFNMCVQRDDYDRYESLPAWARKTLLDHAQDPRDHLYGLEEWEQARTHDPLWNAAQRQLVREGRIHNYLRMLWGKKILEWSSDPWVALDLMTQLNNRYALDGRDPNSYSGIFWILGRYDRPWGPERRVFGKIRFMSSQQTPKKFRCRTYMERYSSA